MALFDADNGYGGLPPGGGYGSSTEYELGAQRIAEALHCVLGSLSRTIEDGKPGRLSCELAHLAEEDALLRRLVEEYSRPVYLRLLNRGGAWPARTRARAIANSPALRRKACDGLAAMDPDLDPPCLSLAARTYRAAYALAEAFEKSLRPQTVRRSAFRDPALREALDAVSSEIAALRARAEAA